MNSSRRFPASVLSIALFAAQAHAAGSSACASSPNGTDCATPATGVLPSSLSILHWYSPGQVVVWPGPPLEAGAQDSVQVGFQNIGYGQSNGTVSLNVEFPPGVHFRHVTNSLPGFTCAAQTQGGREIVACTTPYMYDSQTGYVSMAIEAAADIAVPGPVHFHAAIGNGVQAPPPLCSADPYQQGCGRLSWETRPARVAALAFEGVQHSPAYFTSGGRNGPLVVNFRNLGEGNAAATTLAMRLPPGFHYAKTVNAIPALTCTATGDPSAGQILTCTGGGLPASTSGILGFNVDLDATPGTPGPVVVVGAIDQSSPPATDTLLACAADPDHDDCFWHEIPIFAPCALQYGDDGVYCDGFDVTPPSMDTPAPR